MIETKRFFSTERGVNTIELGHKIGTQQDRKMPKRGSIPTTFK